MNAISYKVQTKFDFNLAVFFLGSISSIKLSLGGEFFFGELFFILYLLLKARHLRFTNIEKRLFFFALLWASAQFFSDILNKTELIASIKGVGAPIVFVFSMLGLVTYFRKKLNNLPSFLLGFFFFKLIQVLLIPGEYAQLNLWKWGLGSSILMLFIVYTSFFRKSNYLTPVLIVIILFFLTSLFFNARTMAFFPLLAFLFFYYVNLDKKLSVPTFFKKNINLSKLIIIAIPLLLIVNFFFTELFSSEAFLSLLPELAAEKYRMQASGSYGALLGGRTELFVSLKAFFDSPIIGHGSWARDTSGIYISQYFQLLYKFGYLQNEAKLFDYELGLIPVHSYIMGAMVWSGILGGLFWIYLLRELIRTFFSYMRSLPYYYYYGMLGLVWSIFFSPFGASARWGTAVFLASYFAYLSFLNKGIIKRK